MNDRIITSPSAIAQLTSLEGDTIEEVTSGLSKGRRLGQNEEWGVEERFLELSLVGSPGVHVEPLVLSGFAASSGNRDRISFVLTGNEASPSHSLSHNSRAEKSSYQGRPT